MCIMQIREGDLIRTIRDNIAHIGHFHTAGVPTRRPDTRPGKWCLLFLAFVLQLLLYFL